MERMKRLKQKQKVELQVFVQSSKSADEVRRAQVILLLDKRGGFSLMESMTGYGRTQAYDIKKRYLQAGIVALEDKRKGMPKELLTKQERERVISTVRTKTPKDLGTYYQNYAHWTTGVLAHWIEKEYGVKYKSKTSLYLVFRKARFTYHKPGRVYDKHNEQAVEQWKRETKPKLKQYWHEKNTIILCEDEMILTTETTTQKIWLPRGEFPKITCTTGGRKRRSVYGFLNLKTGQEHAFKTEYQNMYQTRDILQEIRTLYPAQKIVLLWDNAGWHKGSVTQEYIKQDGSIIEIPFPTYAPEENPQEHVWKQGRTQVTHNRYIENIDEATDELVKYFNETKFPYSLLGFCAVS